MRFTKRLLTILLLNGLSASVLHGQFDTPIYMPSQNEINAHAHCREGLPNVTSTYDPLNGYSLFEGNGADEVIACLVQQHGWESLGPPQYVRGTVRSPRWHDLPLPDSFDDFERGMVARDRGNLSQALSLLGNQARQGHAASQYNLGVIHEEGEGVDKDISKALDYYLEAAGQGHVLAQMRLGNLYDDGIEVKQDYEAAAKWYRAAADQGYLEAQIRLGACYALGEGVPQDVLQAYMWHTIASEQVTRGSMEEMMLRIALELAEDMLTRSEIRAAKKLARQWLADHSDAGRE